MKLPASPKNIHMRHASKVLHPLSEAIKSMKIIKNVNGLSGLKDVDLKIFSELNDRDLFSFCLADKYINKMCKDEHFWRNRFISRFGRVESPKKLSWRKYYLTIISTLDYQNELISLMEKDLLPFFSNNDLNQMNSLKVSINQLNNDSKNTLELISSQSELIALMERNLSPDSNDAKRIHCLQRKLDLLQASDEEEYESGEILLG